MRRRSSPLALVVLAPLALVACRAASGAPGPRGGEIGGATASTAPPPAVDAGLALCSMDAKELVGCRDECDRSVASSCAVLAARLSEGKDAPHDLPGALRAWERACDAGDALACVSASRMWAQGHGAPASREKQVERLTKACELGDATSCMVAGRALAKGSGVPADAAAARRMFEHACGGGVEQGCDALDLDAGT
ncbi:MAG: hypothetical protein R3B36_25620 [Polyangiaceae bacterium]